MKKQTTNAWIDSKIRSMRESIKSNRKKYFALSITLMFINFATIILAAIAIEKLSETGGHSTAMILSAMSAGAIIILFFINAFAIFWKGVMKDKVYKNAIEALQHERMLFAHSDSKYNGKNKEEEFEKEVKKIHSRAINKNEKKKKSLFIRIFVGGNDV